MKANYENILELSAMCFSSRFRVQIRGTFSTVKC